MRGTSHRSMSLDFMMWSLAAITFHGPKVKSCLLLLKPCDIIVEREANINCKWDHQHTFQKGWTGRPWNKGIWVLCKILSLVCCSSINYEFPKGTARFDIHTPSGFKYKWKMVCHSFWYCAVLQKNLWMLWCSGYFQISSCKNMLDSENIRGCLPSLLATFQLETLS